MSSLKGGPIPLPTEAEIEAQAIREREASRREAERILTQEAEQRRAMEGRILAMKSVSQTSLPPPQNPSAATTTPTGSPRRDKDDGTPGWWSTAKARLTPTKELTPAQQIIQETKVKNKTEEKGHKKLEKGKKRATMDPNLNLNIPQQPPTSRPSSAPSSPGALSNSNVSSNPGFGSSTTKLAVTDRASSPNSAVANASKDSPPLYAKFDPTGRLDIPDTLLAIARRFEKLERWTVGHVRALEDRVGDIEKWLVDKEEARQKSEEEYKKEKEGWILRSDLERVSSEVSAVKGSLSEVKARMSEMGRTTAPTMMAYKPAAGSYTPSPAQPPPPISAATSEEAVSSISSRSRLPYPTGDYASPGDFGFSPPASPPPRVRSPPTRSSFAGALTTPSVTSSGLSAPESSTENKEGKPAPRRQSVSPTPRKRYTVALGGPLTSPLEQLAKDFDPSHPSDRSDEGGFFSSAVPDSPPLHAREDTIGGTPINLSRLDSISSPQQQISTASSLNASTDASANSNRTRAQSSYGAPAGWNATKLQSATPPLRMRRKSGGSADASVVGTGGLDAGKPTTTTTTTGTGKFVDPLLVRKKERDGIVSPRTPIGGRGRTVGELAAFFDGDK